jgi:hypothetical protein
MIFARISRRPLIYLRTGQRHHDAFHVSEMELEAIFQRGEGQRSLPDQHALGRVRLAITGPEKPLDKSERSYYFVGHEAGHDQPGEAASRVQG